MTTRKSTPARSRPAAFRRTRADHQTEHAEDYVELIAELQDEQLIRQEPYRAVFLTDAGQKLAEGSRRRHAIVERFLIALGVKAEVARIDAEGIEHHVSADTLDAMERYLKSRDAEPK